MVYRHGDAEQAARLIAGAPGRSVLVTDTVFSMDGDVAPVGALSEACARHGALLVLDEVSAHLDLATETKIAETVSNLRGSSTIPRRGSRSQDPFPCLIVLAKIQAKGVSVNRLRLRMLEDMYGLGDQGYLGSATDRSPITSPFAGPVPEPTTLVLLGIAGIVGLLGKVRRRQTV